MSQIDKQLLRTLVVLASKYDAKDGLFTQLFKDQKPTHGDVVSVNATKNGRKVPVTVLPGTTSRQMHKLDAYSTNEYMVPEFYERALFTISELRKRQMADSSNVVNDRVGSLTLASKAGNQVIEMLQKIIDRGIELQSAQCILEGKVDYVDGERIDFGRDGDLFIDAGTNWGEVADDKVADIELGLDTAHTKSGTNIDTLLFGESSIRNFMKDEKFLKKLDHRYAKLGDVHMPVATFGDSGAKYHGTISIGSYIINLISYNKFYDTFDVDGVKDGIKYYMPQDKVVGISSTEKRERHYCGLHSFADGDIIAGKMFGMSSPYASKKPQRRKVTAFMGDDGLAMKLGLRSRPFAMQYEVDATFVLDTQVGA